MDGGKHDEYNWGEGQPAVNQTQQQKSSSDIALKPTKTSGKSKEKPSPSTPKRADKNKL